MPSSSHGARTAELAREMERLEGQASHLVWFLATGGDSPAVRAELRAIETTLGARDDPPPGAAVAGAPWPRAWRRGGAGGPAGGGVRRAGGGRGRVGAGAGGPGRARGGAGAAAWGRARHADRDVARAAAGAPLRGSTCTPTCGWGRTIGAGLERVCRYMCCARPFAQERPAAAPRRAHRARAEEGVARWDAGVGV